MPFAYTIYANRRFTDWHIVVSIASLTEYTLWKMMLKLNCLSERLLRMSDIRLEDFMTRKKLFLVTALMGVMYAVTAVPTLAAEVESNGGFAEFFSTWLPHIIAGISNGGQYALIAIGYTMVYGILRLINFAHGDIFMVAGLIMVYMSASMPFYISIPLMIALTVFLGFSVERLAYKPLRSAPRMSVMISAIGVSYLIQNLAWYLTGGLAKQYPKIQFLQNTVELGTLKVKNVTLITPILTILLVVALVFLIQKTKIGMAMRAVSRDFEASQLMGIKINSVISTTFIIGSLLAAVGSVLYFSSYTGVTPTVGAMPGLKAFIAAVFGGIGSIPGAVIGAFIIGIVENIIKGFANGLYSTFSDAFTFALLIIILVVKPTGLFGENLKEKV